MWLNMIHEEVKEFENNRYELLQIRLRHEYNIDSVDNILYDIKNALKEKTENKEFLESLEHEVIDINSSKKYSYEVINQINTLLDN